MEHSKVIEKKFVVRSELGLHARPAALFVRTANRFQSDITVQKGRQKVNGKSIMGIMMLAAGPGSSITVRVVGPDAQRAMAEIEKLMDNKMNQ
ncbi:MAG: HPr family phosphocarrier protein [Candidatus Omnitrophica bacterium]|nr:HPr family phosphocarrier protein [Candidatus Omnitrophota bacterium]